MAIAQVTPLHQADGAKDYFDLCLRAAQEFLQTIVVVDDRATYGEPDEIAGSLTAPTSGSSRDDEEVDEDPEYDLGSGSTLDVAALTDASADLGLTCAVLRPRTAEQHDGTLDRRLTKAAQRADVLVLDWQLNDEPGGEAALRLLSDVARDDQQQSARLRLVCIYTSEPDLVRVYEAVLSQLGGSVSSCSGSTSNGMWLHCGCMRVVILSKAGGIGTNPDVTVSEEDLPERLLKEFTHLTAGLVSNVAVAALAAVRQDAHRLLTRFGKSLDPAFLSHRFYEGGAESEELLVRLVADEIKSVLDGADVRRWIASSAVRLWGLEHLPENASLSVGRGRRELDKDTLLQIIEGDEHYGQLKVPNRAQSGDSFDLAKVSKNSITGLLVKTPESAVELDYEFARLTCIARNDTLPFPGDRSPVLTEGTILRGRIGTERVYLLCAMPLCDTVRIKTPRAFPFVPLKSVSHSDRYSLVALSPEGERLHLAFSPKNHYDIVRHTFAGDSTETVRSRREKTPYGERFVFFDVSGKPWIWVAELRFQHAHRKLHELGAASTRVGLDESHVLRMASDK
ncbi:response regulator receiver domain [Streptomyces sp. NPDC088847]|uniref:response regulator receiver domain n=1 Tax=Streptomyces sp. NPDC088847 TaxID=3365909 RepID=UPI0037FB8B08